MPDIGLLQSGPPRSRQVKHEPGPALAPAPAPAPAQRTAIKAMAPAFVAISETVAVQSSVPMPASVPIPSSVPMPSQASAVSQSTAPSAAVAENIRAPRNPPPPAMPLPRLMAAAPAPIRALDLLWLALGLLVIIGTGLGIRDPWPADEPRFAALARDMALSHEWLFPRVGGDLYQDKPPFYFWLLALCYQLTGSVRTSFLLPSFFAAGGVLFLIYDFGRRSVGRGAGLAASLLTLCTLQFVTTMRGAQIDATLCLLTTLSLYALLRHFLLGPAWGWYFLGGFAAGVGVFTKGVGFLPVLMLIPYFSLRAARWQSLPALDAGRGGWRWWLAPLAMLLAIQLWFLPMLMTVAASGSTEYAAYRDEILFKQTVSRYAASWHHVKGWYYFILEVIPALWLPWSLLLIWLAPRFKAAWKERDARVWLPLSWVVLVLLFFSLSPGKRGIYILPALPALCFAAMPFLEELLSRAAVRRTGFVLAIGFFTAGLLMAAGYVAQVPFVLKVLHLAGLPGPAALYCFVALCAAGLWFAYRVQGLLAWPAALAALAVVFSYWIAPALNPERSGSAFVGEVLAKVQPGEELALVAYKEQFLLYLDRPSVNFGHRRWLEGPQEAYDAAAWLNAAPQRVLLVPRKTLSECFAANQMLAGRASSEDWYLVRAPAAEACVLKGDAARAIHYKVAARG